MSDYKEKFEKMRVAGNLAARTLDMLTENIKEGVTTNYIDKLGTGYGWILILIGMAIFAILFYVYFV